MTEKERVLNILKPSREVAIKDLEKLFNRTSNITPNSRIGNSFIDFFMLKEKLETKCRKNISFFELWEKKDDIFKKKHIQNLKKYYEDHLLYKSEESFFYMASRLYYGCINTFKSSIAIDIYRRFKPNSVLDMTMGWGGRLVGACALNVLAYTGIDLNVELKIPYEEMVDVLKDYTTTKITLLFEDALKVDYEKLDYDLVLTSPPYYNAEIYTGTERRSNTEWNENFYKPLFMKTWNGLKDGGHYCLNVPIKVYETILIPLLGEADILIPLSLLKRKIRGLTQSYKEYIYVWKKVV